MYAFFPGADLSSLKAMHLFGLSAARGDARAEYVLAVCYKNGGDGVLPSPEQAFYYFQKAADHGDIDALVKLALCWLEGDGVTQDISKAIKYFRLAADQGDADAAHRLSIVYSTGVGVPVDPAAATKWLELAAAFGQAESQFQLGLQYRHGQGALRQPDVVYIMQIHHFVTSDSSSNFFLQAAEWFRKSADQGHAGAQCALALCYRDGFGLDKSPAQMVYYLQLASAQGHADALYALALCYRDGVGTPKNVAEARRLLAHSFERGNVDAQELLDVLPP